MQVNGKSGKIYVLGDAICKAIPACLIGAAFIAVGVFLMVAKPVDDKGNTPSIWL